MLGHKASMRIVERCIEQLAIMVDKDTSLARRHQLQPASVNTARTQLLIAEDKGSYMQQAQSLRSLTVLSHMALEPGLGSTRSIVPSASHTVRRGRCHVPWLDVAMPKSLKHMFLPSVLYESSI